MAEVLIVYATLLGHTRRIGERVAEALHAAGCAPVLADVDAAPALDGFDAAIVGAPVRSASFLATVERYVRVHAVDLARLPSGLYAVSSPDEHDDRAVRHELDRYIRELLGAARWHPDVIASFAGVRPYTHLGLAHQVLGSEAAQPQPGAAEGSAATDWDAVAGFVEAFLHHLRRADATVDVSSARRAST